MRLSLRRAVAVFLLGLVLVAACKRSDAKVAVQENDRAADVEDAKPRPPDLADRAFPLLAWSVHSVEAEYFDRTRFDPRGQLLSALEGLGRQTPEFFAEVAGDIVTLRVREARTTFDLAQLGALSDAASMLEAMLVFAQAELNLEPDALHTMEYAAINGLLAPLDPHTILLTPEEHADLGERTRGSFGGIGAEIRTEGRNVVIIRVLPGMPAERSGVQAGDVLLRIAGQSTVSMSIAKAQELLRGPVGSTVDVKVRRSKSKSLDITIERAVIRLDSVTQAALPDGATYVRISNFQEDTATKLRDVLARAAESGQLESLVLDLRGNGGGLLVQATQIVDMFVPRGELVIVRSAFGREVDDAQTSTALSGDVPVVVLVDERAASAAEIVSGGLQALGRAVVLGRSTFGKGSVQVVRPSAPYGRELALKLTVAEYLVAGDTKIQARGVVPDLELLPVEPTGFEHVVRYYDLERFERARERAQMAHHPSAKHEAEHAVPVRSSSRLRYLASSELPRSLADVSDLPDVMYDPEVRIAAEVARAIPTRLDAEARRRAVEQVRAALSVEEDTRIRGALADASVQWGAEGSHEPELVTVARIVTPLPVEAGSTFELEVSVTNLGEDVAHRVHAITDCEREQLDGIEVLFGDIEPGQTQSRKIELHVMSWYADFVGELDVEVHAGEPDGIPDASSRTIFETQARSRPALSYDFWIVDDPALVPVAPKRPASEPVPGLPTFSVAGNGDGMLQPGERVLLAFRAYNRGAGESPNVRAFLRNLSGEQGLLEEGFVELGAVPVGESVSGAFGFWVREDADPARPVLLDLTVGDASLRVMASDSMRLSVLPHAAPREALASTLRVEHGALKLRAGAHASSAVAADVAVGDTIRFEGTFGAWRYAVAPGEPSRRLFAPADHTRLVAVETPSQVAPSLRRSVRPPTLVVQPVPRQTTASAVELRLDASHPRMLRDVLVMVRPGGPGQVDKKIEYVPAHAGETALTLRTEIPLAKGGNRIFILARSAGDVQTSRELWVYRGESG